jgi:hypothetical protein
MNKSCQFFFFKVDSVLCPSGWSLDERLSPDCVPSDQLGGHETGKSGARGAARANRRKS